MTKNEKIFCINCRYFKTFIGVLGSYREWCRAPQNRKDTYRAKADLFENSPKDINKNNDCSWFEAGLGKHVNLS